MTDSCFCDVAGMHNVVAAQALARSAGQYMLKI